MSNKRKANNKDTINDILSDAEDVDYLVTADDNEEEDQEDSDYEEEYDSEGEKERTHLNNLLKSLTSEDEGNATKEEDEESSEEEEEEEDADDEESLGENNIEDVEDDDDDSLLDDESSEEENEDLKEKKKREDKLTEEEGEDESSEEESDEDSSEEESKEDSKGKEEANKSSDSSSQKLKGRLLKEKLDDNRKKILEKLNHDEYAEDSSDEEDLRNTIGNIPINWYDEYPHIGYNLEGKQIIKPIKGDSLDKFLDRRENPDFGRTVLDKQTGQDVRLSDSALDVVQRVMDNKVPDASYNYYAPWIDFFTHEVMDMPLSGRHETKRSFLPPENEKKIIERYVRAIKRHGTLWKKQKESSFAFDYDLWKDDPTLNKYVSKIYNPMPAPKERKPGHGESYRPPIEFMFTKKETRNWKRKIQRAKDEPEIDLSAFYNFIPQRQDSIRKIPGYYNFLQERYNRCLDLYLAPRKTIYRIQAKSQDLIPKLPRPRDLRPFPTREELKLKAHRSIIRTISMHPHGRYLASGSDDHSVKIWEVSTGRCVKSFDIGGVIRCVTWNPHKDLFLLAVVCEYQVILLNPESYLVDKLVVQKTNSAFQQEPDQGDYIAPPRVSAAVTWRKATADEWAKGYRCILKFFSEVTSLVWHRQGDYFATLCPEGITRSVIMHQLSRWRSQLPFNKCKGRVKAISFHPKVPYFYVCTDTHIRVYHLQRQKLEKKVKGFANHISCIAVHPSGNHFLVGTLDRNSKINWFEMENTKQPFALRYHHDAVRSVAFHRKYPLFASASDDGRVIVCHGMVYNDWIKDPLIVPVKDLFGHKKVDGYCAMDIAWHPYQPWIFTADAFGVIRLYH